jgi:hypothetical protein
MKITDKGKAALLEEMNPVTRQVAQAGLEQIHSGYRASLVSQYNLGLQINKIFVSAISDAIKKDELKKLLEYWGQPNLTLTTLYDLRNVAVSFDKQFIEAQFNERLADGSYITWSHFKELQKVSSPKKQLALLNQIRQNSWSAKEFTLQLQASGSAEIKRGGGRKPAVPKTPSAMLQKIYNSAQLTGNYLEAVSEPLTGIFMEISPSDIDEKFVDSISSTLELLQQTEDRIQETRNNLKKVMNRSKKVLTISAAAKVKPEK